MTQKHFVVRVEGRDRKPFWRARRWWSTQIAANGKIVYTSETYTTREKRDETAKATADQLGVKFITYDGDPR